MKLSFVIPAYNEENYIGDCLKSIVDQKRGLPYAIEIIVVNNASTDGTEAVIKQYPEVKLVYEKEKGIVKARKAGFLAATGDLIANVDSDSRLTPGWIEKVMTSFKKDERLVGLSGPFIFYDAPRKVLIFTSIYYRIGFFLYLINRFIFRVGSMLQGGNFVVRRSAMEKIGGFNTNIDFYGEDSDIAKRLNEVGKVRFTFKLPMYSSSRRLAKEGFLTMAFRYSLNYLWITFFRKPFSNSSIDIRLTNKNTPIFSAENRLKEWAIGIGALVIFLCMAGVIAYFIYYTAHYIPH